jgi:RNA polymerase sigma-70 factor, ECF subfamily
MFEISIKRLFSSRESYNLTAGDFAHLYESHAKMILNYCLFRVGDRTTAEDITADAFERAWQHRQRYCPDQASFKTWLLTITRHLIIDWQRKNSHQTLVALDEQQPSNKMLPEAEIEQAEQLSHLYLLVQTLPDHERELIALKFGAGLTNRKIGEILHKSETAVGSAIYRTMQKLRQQWEVPHVEKSDA